MVEVTMTWDFVPGADMSAYEAFTKQAIQQVLAAPGLVEIRAHRNLLGSPQVRATYVFESAADFARSVVSLASSARAWTCRGACITRALDRLQHRS